MTARPLSQHRLSISGSPSSFATTRHPSHSHHSHSRNHSSSTLSGALNASHRVTRRKSMTSNGGTNIAAVAAALNEAGDQVTPLPIAGNPRRGTMSKPAAARPAIVGSLPSPPASLPTQRFMNAKMEGQDTAIDDDSNDMSADEGEVGHDKARVRRASDGQPLSKDGKKSRAELRCEKCGKGYKHSSCLTKHLFVPISLSHCPSPECSRPGRCVVHVLCDGSRTPPVEKPQAQEDGDE